MLDRGGLVLSSMEITTSPSEADFVINQYGAIGASGILKFPNDTLESDTKTSISGFTNSLNIEKGAIYLIVLHDGSFAKIRIDRFLPEQGISITKVFYLCNGKERVKTSQVGAVGNDLPNDVFPEIILATKIFPKILVPALTHRLGLKAAAPANFRPLEIIKPALPVAAMRLPMRDSWNFPFLFTCL